MLVGETESTGLEDLLKGFNVEVGKGFIVEPRLNYRGKADALVVQGRRASRTRSSTR